VEASKVSIAKGVRTLAVLTLAGTLTVVAACSSGTASGPAASTATSSMSTTPSPSGSFSSPTDQAKQAALVAYRGMWQDFVVAGHTSDWQSASLGQYATGIALTNMSRGLYTDHYNGLVTKGAPVLSPRVSSVDPPGAPTKITITDCGDSTNWLKYRADNGQLDDTPGGRRLINAIVEKQSDGSWKVTDFGVHDLGTC
jgi:hypothetical protein